MTIIRSLIYCKAGRCPGSMEHTERHFTFHSGGSTGEVLRVTVPEILDPAYGMYVWPSAPVLAKYVWHNRDKVVNKRVLEIGAGTALPGIVAAKCGGNVTLSDCKNLPQCQENSRLSCKANQLNNVTVIGLTWGKFDAELISMDPVDIILGSDCFYSTKDFEDIFATVAFLLERSPNAEFWCSYQERSSKRSIEFLLLKWGLLCKPVALDTFGADTSFCEDSDMVGDQSIQMFIITKEKS